MIILGIHAGHNASAGLMVDGRIVYSGGFELVHVLEEHGYGWAEEQIRKGETVSPPEAVAG